MLWVREEDAEEVEVQASRKGMDFLM